MNLIVVLILVLVLFGGGGYYGHSIGINPLYLGTGGIGGLILLLIILRLVGLI